LAAGVSLVLSDPGVSAGIQHPREVVHGRSAVGVVPVLI